MRSLKWFGVALIALAIAVPQAEAAPRSGAASKGRQPQRAAASIDNSGRMDANNLDMIVTNHGSIAFDLITGNAGLIYPKGGTRTSVFASGLWLGAKVAGETRVAIGEYSQEFTPGPMAGGTFQPDVPEFRNYRIERGGEGYADYLTYAVPQGAPLDSLGDPLLLGDATVWSVFNDADAGVHTNMSTAPLGIEVQQTVFAYNRAGPLGNIIFVKWKFINKGGNTLDSTFVSVWSDPDLGGFTDDLVGCDTTLSLGFCYNATNADGQYGSRPPAVGYDFFRGPIVQVSPGVFDTLGMTSFNKYINGTDPATASETYNYMSGLQADGTPIHVNDDPLQPITRFQVSGDPVAGTGWLDSNPADRRLFLSSGPFTMAPGDSQEIVTAIIIGQGSDRLSSISDLKQKDAVAQTVFDLNFDIPAPPPAPTVYSQPLDRGVRLVWGSEPVGDVQIQSNLNQEFHFEGFRVWQMSSNSADSDPTVIATFDVANGVTSIFTDEFNSNSGAIERTLKVAGSDHGLEFQIDLTQDALRGGPLINNKDYYYAVTAYSYDVNNTVPFFVGGTEIGVISEVLESARNPSRHQPRSSAAIFSVAPQAVTTGATNLTGAVEVEQVVQADITGDLYSVTFDDQERWTLQNLTDASTLLTNQTVIDGSFNNPVVEGVMVRPTAPRGVAAIGELRADSTITDLTPSTSNQDTTGTWHFSGSDLSRFIPFYATFNHLTNHDYEIRIKAPADTTEYAWGYASGEVSFVTSYRVPFEVWDLGFNTPSDPSDDVKISVMARDVDLDGAWSWGDILYFRQIPYASVPWTTPGTKSTDFNPTGLDQSLGFFRFILDDTGYTDPSPPATTIRIYGERFSSADEYQFRTAPVGSGPGTVVGQDVKKILAVPNPYYARSSYELTQFDRVMKFTNIPASRLVTIRIFNLGGDLVRTIRREATTAEEQAVATIEWNLNTDRNLPVASGVYIYRVDIEGVGSKTDRIAVFFEQERLDNF